MSKPPALPGSSSSLRPIRLVVIGTLLTFVVLLAGCLFFMHLSHSKAVKQLEANARHKHEPLTLSELATNFPPVPENENAASALIAIWQKEDPALWTAFLRGDAVLPESSHANTDPGVPLLGKSSQVVKRSESLTPERLAAAEAYVREQAQHLEAVRAAMTRPHCRFPIKISEGLNAPVPHLSELKREVQNFRLVALVALERQDVDGTLEALEDAARCAHLFSEETFLIGHMTRLSCYSVLIQDAERLLSRETLSGLQLDRLEKLIRGLDVQGVLRTAFVAERAAALSVFDPSSDALASRSRTDEDTSASDAETVRAGMRFIMSTGIGSADRRFMLECFAQAIDLAEDGSAEALDKSEQLFQQAQQQARKFPPKVFSAMLLPSLQGVAGRFATFEARRRAALTAIAVDRYRSNHNMQLPDALAQLVPDFVARIPADPFCGQPLIFKRLENGFMVYSVGRNRKDDGGKERPDKRTPKDYDLTFIVEH